MYSSTPLVPNSTTIAAPSTECKLDSDSDIALIIGYIAVIIIGVSGNLLVYIIFLPKWRKGPIIELLILYLAFFDMIGSFVGPFVFLYWILVCFQRWDFGTIGCKILPPFSRISTNISIGVILIMAIDRCRAIVFPLKRRFTRKTIHISIAFTVILSFVWETYYIISLHVDSQGVCTLTLANEPTFAYPLITLTVTRTVIFLLVFVATTLAVYLKLLKCQQNRLLQSNSLKRARKSKSVMRMLVTMAVVFALVVIPRDVLHLTFTISWLPGEGGIQPTPALIFWNKALRLLQLSNGIYNVFIYGKMHDNFWTRAKYTLQCKSHEIFEGSGRINTKATKKAALARNATTQIILQKVRVLSKDNEMGYIKNGSINKNRCSQKNGFDKKTNGDIDINCYETPS